MGWRRFLVFWCLGILGFCALVGALNALVDPYGLLGTPAIRGLNVVKPAATTRTRVVKPVQGERAKPSTLILGNSRPEMGLDPESPVWLAKEKPVYNGGLPGASVYMTMRYGQDILESGRTDLVLWGLDFADFLNDTSSARDLCAWPPPPEEWEGRLKVTESLSPTEGWRIQRLQDYGVSILSTQAMVESLSTIFAQTRPGSGTRTPLGFNPAADYIPIIRSEGQHVLFAQKNAEMESRLIGKKWRLASQPCDSSLDFRSVERLLSMANQRGIRVVLFINPYHADYLDVIWRAGLWGLFEDWKRRLLTLSLEAGAEALWDFSQLNEFTTETPPPAGNRDSSLKWFWEPAHYRAGLGELMLQEMLGRGPRDQATVGVRLTADGIDELLAGQRELARKTFEFRVKR